MDVTLEPVSLPKASVVVHQMQKNVVHHPKVRKSCPFLIEEYAHSRREHEAYGPDYGQKHWM